MSQEIFGAAFLNDSRIAQGIVNWVGENGIVVRFGRGGRRLGGQQVWSSLYLAVGHVYCDVGMNAAYREARGPTFLGL